VYSDLDELIDRIQKDQTQRQRQKLEESLSISVFNSVINEEGRSSTKLDGQFLHSQLLID
jgi:hypothetical protein